MQKTEYGYGKVVRIGILCLIFAICMEKHTYGSIVVDEVLIGGQEEHAPSDAAPAAQASAEPNAAKSTSEQQAEPDASKPQAEPDTLQPASKPQADPDTSQPTSESQTKPGSQSTSTSQEKSSTYLQNEKKVQDPSIKQADTTSTAQTDPGQPQVPAESTSSVSANDKQQFHIPQQETEKQTEGNKTTKSENSSGKNTSGETAKREMKAQEQPSIWQDTAETADKEKMENKAESEDKTGSLLLPGFMILCIVLLLAGSICLIRDNNIDLKK